MKILIADDHVLVRDGLKPLLAGLERDVHVVEACDLASLLEAVQTHPDIDLALVDLQMPGMQGVQSIVSLRNAFPSLPVMVLSALEIAIDIEALLRSGASGYISKASSSEVIASAIRLVLSGGQYLPPQLLRPIAGDEPIAERTPVPSGTEFSARARQLSPRQHEVVGLLAQGLSNKQIARRLGLVEGTVKSHLVQIFHVLGVHNRTSAVVAARALQDPNQRTTH